MSLILISMAAAVACIALLGLAVTLAVRRALVLARAVPRRRRARSA